MSVKQVVTSYNVQIKQNHLAMGDHYALLNGFYELKLSMQVYSHCFSMSYNLVNCQHIATLEKDNSCVI